MSTNCVTILSYYNLTVGFLIVYLSYKKLTEILICQYITTPLNNNALLLKGET